MTLTRYKTDEVPKATKEDLDRFDAIKEEDIDLSDIPELTEDFWKNAKRGDFYKPRKEQITIKIDADVLAWLKSNGKGYQTRLNAILRHEMLSKRKTN